MYRHCLFCNADLGRNEVVEPFPVGRRLAFDPAKGRLWVVCRKCERWNLSPLDERWEAIEECERLFRDARLRVSTDHVGFAKLKEGLELVRIGDPQRPEFAAWRYGDQFGRRRTRNLLMAGAGVAAAGALIAGQVAIAGGGVFLLNFVGMARSAIFGSPDTVVTHVPTRRGLVPVKREELKQVRIRPTELAEGWMLHVECGDGFEHLTGEPARRMLGSLLPHVNRFGASRGRVASAVERVEEAGGSDAFVQRALVSRARHGHPRGASAGRTGFALLDFDSRDLLALEMALHEEQERRAMQGELAALAERWKEAEEIAAIADDLFSPSGIAERLARLRRRARGEE